MALTLEEQMQMMDLELSKGTASTPKQDEYKRQTLSPIPTAGNEIIQGSFTGVRITPTIQPRQGRPLLAPGIRIYDRELLNEVKNQNTKR